MRKLFAGLAAMAIAAFGAAEARADKLQDILSKGVVRIGVPLDAPPFGSRVVFMHEGRIHEQGPAAAVLAEPKTPELQTFLSAVLH